MVFVNISQKSPGYRLRHALSTRFTAKYKMLETKFDVFDIVAVVLYFAAVIGAGLISMCRTNRGSAAGYFLAGRHMIWLPVGASIFASNIGSEHFIGLAGSGAAAGIAVGAFELNSCIILQLLGWIFLPVYIACGVYTLPEYMSRRFGGRRIRVYLSVLSLLLYIFTKISVNLYSGALFIQLALNWNLYVSVALILLATAVCTVTGGLAAVIYTDTLQCFIMIVGATILTVLSFTYVGGYAGLYESYMAARPNTTMYTYPNTTCADPRPDSWVMLRDPVGSDLPWPGFILGQTTASIWYWCADQMMVQRALAAKTLSHAQGGTLFAGYLKLLPVFIMVLPGMIARVLFTDEIACADADVCQSICQNSVSCSNIAYPRLVLTIMPSGLRGLMLSVMLAALMSDLTSIFNSAATLFTMDIYRLVVPAASTRRLMIVGRCWVVVMVGIGLLWIPVVAGQQGGQLYHYIQAVAAYLAPPIAAVYVLAVAWKRTNEKGAFSGLMVGFLLGAARLVTDFFYPAPHCDQIDHRPRFLIYVHYMYFALFLFITTAAVAILVSLCTKPPTDKQLDKTTFWTRKNLENEPRKDIELTVCMSTFQTEPCMSASQKDGGEGASQGEPLKEPCLDATKDELEKEQSEETKSGYICTCWQWFCGLHNTEGESAPTIQLLTSIKQNTVAKVVLNILLALLITITVALFVFFTTGSDLGLLS